MGTTPEQTSSPDSPARVLQSRDTTYSVETHLNTAESMKDEGCQLQGSSSTHMFPSRNGQSHPSIRAVPARVAPGVAVLELRRESQDETS